MKIYHLLLVGCLASLITCLDNGLGLTPPMGWNSWNRFGCNINQSMAIQTAELLVSTGLSKKGYKYLNLDDCWQVHLVGFRNRGTLTATKSRKTRRSFHRASHPSSTTSTRRDCFLGCTVTQGRKLARAVQAATGMKASMPRHMRGGGTFVVR